MKLIKDKVYIVAPDCDNSIGDGYCPYWSSDDRRIMFTDDTPTIYSGWKHFRHATTNGGYWLHPDFVRLYVKPEYISVFGILDKYGVAS